MKAIIMAYRGSHKTQDTRRMILKPEGSTSKETAEKLVGKHAVFKTKTGKEIKGLITKAHGCNGAILARFDHGGLPGQSLGKQISIE